MNRSLLPTGLGIGPKALQKCYIMTIDEWLINP
jgi:hypothetical protein